MATLRSLIEDGPIAINLGLEEFAKTLEDQGKRVIHVEWTPTPPVDEEMQDILNELL